MPSSARRQSVRMVDAFCHVVFGDVYGPWRCTAQGHRHDDLPVAQNPRGRGDRPRFTQDSCVTFSTGMIRFEAPLS